MLGKINFYLRIFERFGLLVNLIGTCIKDIIPFTVYLAIYVLGLDMLYMQCNI